MSKFWEMNKEENKTFETGVAGCQSVEALINGLFLAELEGEKIAVAQQWHTRLQVCTSDYHTIAKNNCKVPTSIITLGNAHLAVLL